MPVVRDIRHSPQRLKHTRGSAIALEQAERESTNMLFDQMTEYVGDEYWVSVLKRMSTAPPEEFQNCGAGAHVSAPRREGRLSD